MDVGIKEAVKTLSFIYSMSVTWPDALVCAWSLQLSLSQLACIVQFFYFFFIISNAALMDSWLTCFLLFLDKEMQEFILTVLWGLYKDYIPFKQRTSWGALFLNSQRKLHLCLFLFLVVFLTVLHFSAGCLSTEERVVNGALSYFKRFMLMFVQIG